MKTAFLLITALFPTYTISSPIITGLRLPVEPKNTDYPFMVNLLQKTGKTYFSFCGGSLIHPQWVLSAAHCIQLPGEKPINLSESYLGMGSIYRDSKGGQIIAMGEVFTHEKFLKDYSSDVSVIKAQEPFQLGDTVNLINLQTSSESLVGKTVQLTGFGAINDLMMLPQRLRLATFNVGPAWKCLDDDYDSIHICAVSWVEGGGKSCKGDSGGPLFLKNDGNFTQVGLTSRGVLFICQLNLNNSVYTRVSAFVEWIANKTGLTFD